MRRISLAWSLSVVTFAACASSAPGVGSTTIDMNTDDAAPDLAPPADLAPPPRPTPSSLTPMNAKVNVGDMLMLTLAMSDRWYGQTPLTIELQTSDPNVLKLPQPTVTLSFNQMQAQVAVAASMVGTADVTATLDGVSTKASVTVLPKVLGVSPSPLRVLAGQTATLTVTLTDAALAGGHDLVLASADSTVATVPATLHFDAGQRTAQFTLTAIAQGGPIGVSATLEKSKQSTLVSSITPVDRLAIAEVMYDPASFDDGYEWVELWNGGTTDIDLSGYFLGTTSSSMTTSYYASTPALTGTLKAGECKVVGGPMSGPMSNSLAVDFMFIDPVQFNPALPNGMATTAVGVSLFKGTPPATSKPVDANSMMVDAVIYGTMQRGIADETGGTTRLDVPYIAFANQTLERLGPSKWRVQPKPTGGNCDWMHP